MPKRAKGLSATQVNAAKSPGMLGDGGGLYLQVSAGGAKSWIYRYKLGGRRRDMGLGTAGDKDVTLKRARELAAEAREKVRQGVDPIEARRAERSAQAIEAAKTMTFKDCATAYIAAHQAGWKNPKHAKQWPSTLETYCYPHFGSLPVQAIDVGLVMKVLEPIWQTKPETASRVRGRIEAVLGWAATRGYRHGENPARWKGHLENLLPQKAKVRRVEHHAALPYAELPTFMIELQQQGGIGARALEFAILTAARTGEVIGAKWSEIDLEVRLWTLPAERMKGGREHRVPLGEPALAILEGMREIRVGDYVFPGAKSGQPLSNMAFLMLLRRMGRGDLTAHGFRSTFSDWCAEQTNFPSEVREMALAHVVGDKVEAAYRRGDLFQKRRQLAEAWGRYCTAPTSTGQVLPMMKRRAR
jgi:integrase